MAVDAGDGLDPEAFSGALGPEEREGEQPDRGWLPPEDRLWRHPSELGPPQAGRIRSVAARVGNRRGVLAACALGTAVAAVAGVAAVTASGGGRPPVNATDTSVAVGPDVVKVVDAVQDSLVSLVPSGARPGTRATGVVLPAGDLVVTAASAVDQGEQFTVVASSGRHQRAVVAGVDDLAGVAVLQLAGRLSPGSFVDEPMAPQQLAVAACRCTSSSGSASAGAVPDAALGMVRAEGSPALQGGGPSLIDAIEVEMPLGSSALGSVLLDDNGDVLGVLDSERSAGGYTMAWFVPTAVAVPVADELATFHKAARGWLGVECTDDGGAGARVTEVLPASPAADGGLEPGDVVEAVDSHQLSSLADLQARLYAALPGTRLELTVLRSGAIHTLVVTVATKPS